jgi:hypothetical protein
MAFTLPLGGYFKEPTTFTEVHTRFVEFPESPLINSVVLWSGVYFRWSGTEWQTTLPIVVHESAGSDGGVLSNLESITYMFDNNALANGQFIAIHSKGVEANSIELYNNNNEQVLAGIQSTINSIVVDVGGFVPIQGSWRLEVIFPIV